MKVLFSLVFALFMTSTLAESKNIDWVKIAPLSNDLIGVYIDYKSFESITDEDGTTTAAAALLTHRQEPEKKNFGIGDVQVTSLIRWLFVDCSTGIVFPMREFYFNQETLPKSGDPTVGAIIHTPKTVEKKILPKENPIRVIMCPETENS